MLEIIKEFKGQIMLLTISAYVSYTVIFLGIK